MFMSSQQLATMRASRPLPEFPEDTHEIGDWRLKWDHAWEIHSMGVPGEYHLDILGQKLPPRLHEYLQNLVLRGKKGVPVTYDMFMDYLMSRETTNPYVGRKRWADMAGPSANTLEALEDFQIRWETTINRCNDLSLEETYAQLINKLQPAMKKLIEDKEKKMHRRECWVSHVGPRVDDDTIADLVYECCDDNPQYRVGRTSNSTIVKFTSEDSGVHAMQLTGRASGFAAPGGEPYKFTKIPVTMSIEAVWKHLKSEMSVLQYSRSTRDAIKGRLNEDKHPGGAGGLPDPIGDADQPVQ